MKFPKINMITNIKYKNLPLKRKNNLISHTLYRLAVRMNLEHHYFARQNRSPKKIEKENLAIVKIRKIVVDDLGNFRSLFTNLHSYFSSD